MIKEFEPFLRSGIMAGLYAQERDKPLIKKSINGVKLAKLSTVGLQLVSSKSKKKTFKRFTTMLAQCVPGIKDKKVRQELKNYLKSVTST